MIRKIFRFDYNLPTSFTFLYNKIGLNLCVNKQYLHRFFVHLYIISYNYRLVTKFGIENYNY